MINCQKKVRFRNDSSITHKNICSKAYVYYVSFYPLFLWKKWIKWLKTNFSALKSFSECGKSTSYTPMSFLKIILAHNFLWQYCTKKMRLTVLVKTLSSVATDLVNFKVLENSPYRQNLCVTCVTGRDALLRCGGMHDLVVTHVNCHVSGVEDKVAGLCLSQ